MRFRKSFRRSFRRRTGGRRRFRRAGSFANRVRSALKRVSEKKGYQVFVSSTATTSGTLVELFTVANGTASNQRIGQTIRPKAIYGWYQWAGGDETNNVRIMLVYSKEPLTTATFPAALAPYDVFTSPPIHIIKDEVTCVGAGLSGGGSDVSQNIIGQIPFVKTKKWRIKLRGVKHFSSTGTGDGQTGFHYIYVVSDSIAPSHPAYSLNFNVSYVDV